MKSKKKLLKESRLYIILDRKVCGNSLIRIAGGLIKNNFPKIVQLRDKYPKKKELLSSAFALKRLCAGQKTILIINDYLDVARIADSDGIHLGQTDIPIESARRILGSDKIIGISCHSLKEAIAAQKRGADYIGWGPVFPTPTKPAARAIGLDLIARLKHKIRIPFFVIGGIDLSNTGQIISAGARRIAVCRAICKAKDTELASRKLVNSLG